MTVGEPVTIRPFQPTDREQVLALAPHLTEGAAAWRDPAGVLAAARGWVQASIGAAGDPDHSVYVATSGGRVAGFVTVCEQAHFTGEAEAYVGELVVDPGQQRRGIATALMDAAQAWAASRGLRLVTLHTGAANQGARAFYAHLGYREEDVRLTKAVRPAGRRASPAR